MAWQGTKPTDFALQVVSESEEHIKKIIGVAIQTVVTMSPVDEGAYRGNHRLSINSIDLAFDPTKMDLSGSVTIQDMMTKAVQVKLGDTVYLQNNAPYAVRLENGWSQQAPSGVYAIAFANMSNVK